MSFIKIASKDETSYIYSGDIFAFNIVKEYDKWVIYVQSIYGTGIKIAGEYDTKQEAELVVERHTYQVNRPYPKFDCNGCTPNSTWFNPPRW